MSLYLFLSLFLGKRDRIKNNRRMGHLFQHMLLKVRLNVCSLPIFGAVVSFTIYSLLRTVFVLH